MTDALTLSLDLRGQRNRSYSTATYPIGQPECRRDQHALTLRDASDGGLLANRQKAGSGFRDAVAAIGLISGTFTAPDLGALVFGEVGA